MDTIHLATTVQGLVTEIHELRSRVESLERLVPKQPDSFTLEPDPLPRSKRFQPPTLDESMLYAASIGLSKTDHDQWRTYYEANGWRVGRNPMKDWKACLRHWQSNLGYRPGRSGSVALSLSNPSGAQLIVYQKELEAASRRIHDITPEGMLDPDEQTRAELVKLKARVKELKRILGREF